VSERVRSSYSFLWFCFFFFCSTKRRNSSRNGFASSTIPNNNDIDGSEKKVSSSLDFETDLNLLSKYGYSTNAQPMRGNTASLSWELPEADFVAFMTNLPSQRTNSISKGLDFGLQDNVDADNGEITDEYGVCSIINNSEQFNPEVILHEFDEDLLQRDEANDKSGVSPRPHQTRFTGRVPFESKLLNFRTSTKPLLKSEENIGSSETDNSQAGATKEVPMSSSAPTTSSLNSTGAISGTPPTDEDKIRGARGKPTTKRSSQNIKNQPKVRMSLAQFLTVTGDEV